MQYRSEERVPLSKLQIIEEMPTPLKRKAKIFSNKLPNDFFLNRNTPRQPNRDQIHTQNFSRKIPSFQRISETRELNIRGGNQSARIRNDQE